MQSPIILIFSSKQDANLSFQTWCFLFTIYHRNLHRRIESTWYLGDYKGAEQQSSWIFQIWEEGKAAGHTAMSTLEKREAEPGTRPPLHQMATIDLGSLNLETEVSPYISE